LGGVFGVDVSIAPSQPRFIYITGCDGTGKSTQVEMMMVYLNGLGISPRHLWLRYPNIFSLPFLAFARLRGLSWREEGGGVVHGFWDFRGSWLMEKVYPWVLLLDAILVSFWKVLIPIWMGKTIVCERYVLDMLVDLSLAFGGKDVFTIPPGKYLLRLLPVMARVFVLDLDRDTIVARRPNLVFDHHLEMRLKVFRGLAQTLGLMVFSSQPDVVTVHQQIVEALVDGFSGSSYETKR
jgi:hypothetical protein